jgi:acetyl esterase/lipase
MTVPRRGLLAMLTAGLSAGCSPAALLNATAPRDGIDADTDLAYAPGARHGVDIYRPSGAAGRPVVVFLYGGGWRSGDRAMYRFVGASLAASGLICAIPDYRVYPEVRFPDFVQDAAEAVAWMRRRAPAYGGDPDRLFVMGHSAGAQIATLLGLNPAYLGAHGLTPDRDLSGVIGLSGPYDFLPLRTEELKAIFGPEDQRPSTQPINFVTPGAPPMLLATGGADTTVLPRNTERLAVRLREAGDPVESIVYPGVGHAAVIGAFAAALRFIAPVRRDVLRFIRERSVA